MKVGDRVRLTSRTGAERRCGIDVGDCGTVTKNDNDIIVMVLFDGKPCAEPANKDDLSHPCLRSSLVDFCTDAK